MVKRIGQRIFLSWFILAAANVGMSETVTSIPTDALANYKIRRWTTEDGLPQNRIACMQQTRDGYLWLGTWFGLVRFDGVRFTVFNKQNTPALAEDAISALAQDSEGNLWLGTRAGLVKYAGGKFSRFTVADGLPADAIWRLPPRVPVAFGCRRAIKLCAVNTITFGPSGNTRMAKRFTRCKKTRMAG